VTVISLSGHESGASAQRKGGWLAGPHLSLNSLTFGCFLRTSIQRPQVSAIQCSAAAAVSDVIGVCGAQRRREAKEDAELRESSAKRQRERDAHKVLSNFFGQVEHMDSNEAFLRDYILNKGWLDKDQRDVEVENHSAAGMWVHDARREEGWAAIGRDALQRRCA
jgi:hypothetical protein